jgi:tetrahydromethanopterin S-methyltransferase subunit A
MGLFTRITQLIKRPSTGLKSKTEQWPFYRGPYAVVDATAAVVVTTLGSDKLAEDLVALAPPGLCMACPLTGGRADIERLAHTLIANLSIQHLVCVGDESRKRVSLTALQALFEASPDELDAALEAAGASKMRLTAADVDTLRKQVQFNDMHGCNEIDQIITRVRDLSLETKSRVTGFVAQGRDAAGPEKRVIAADNITHNMEFDKAGDFKISVAAGCITVEHYNNKDELLRIVEGTSARSICLTLIRNGWISKLDHAAYLGRELSRAESALQNGDAYIQDVDAASAGH